MLEASVDIVKQIYREKRVIRFFQMLITEVLKKS